MGYQAPIALEDERHVEWVGEHRPELVDLGEIFRHVVTLDVAQLDVGPSAVVEAWRKALPESVHVIRALSPRVVHVHAPHAGVRDFVLKVSLPHAERGLRRITARVERSRAHRAHLWAHRLRALGIATPRPLGFLERASTPARFVSFSASEFVEAPVLVELREQGFGLLGVRQPRAVLEAKRTLITRVAGLLRQMHANGVFHPAIDAGSILVAKDEVLLLELDRLRTFALAEPRRLEALVRLQRAFAATPWLTRSDRLRFLSAYLRHDADRDARVRTSWREIAGAARPTVPAAPQAPTTEPAASSTQPNPAL